MKIVSLGFVACVFLSSDFMTMKAISFAEKCFMKPHSFILAFHARRLREQIRKRCGVAGLGSTDLRLKAYFALIASMVASRVSSRIMYRLLMSSLYLTHLWSLRLRRIDLGDGSGVIRLLLKMAGFRVIARGYRHEKLEMVRGCLQAPALSVKTV